MIQNIPSNTRFLGWFATGFWLLFIFIGSFFGRIIQKLFPKAEIFIPYVGMLLMILIVFYVYYYVKSQHPFDRANNIFRLFLFIIISLCIAFIIFLTTLFLIDFKIEFIHIIKYGILSVLVFFVNNTKTYTRRIFFTILVTSVIGIIEEALQIWIPNRFFDPKDILLNIVSCLIGTLYSFLLSISIKSRKNY
jgi:VanZ family protein